MNHNGICESFNNGLGDNDCVSDSDGVAVCAVCCKADVFSILCDRVYLSDRMRNEIA
jgi:hypothetical protein